MRLLPSCLLLLLCLCLGCNRTEDIRLWRWEPIDPRADSIIELMDRWYAFDNPADSQMPRLTAELEDRCSTLPDNKQLKARFYYWKALQFSRKDMFDSAGSYRDLALAMMDTVKYPYDYARLKVVRGRQSTRDLIEYMSDAGAALQYFKTTADSLMWANTANVLSLIYLQLGETGYRDALSLCQQAADLYWGLGLKTRYNITQINRALILKAMGLPDSSRAVLDSLKKAHVTFTNEFVYSKLLINLGAVGDTTALREGIDMMKNSPQRQKELMRFREYLAENKLLDGCRDEAEALARPDIEVAKRVLKEGKETGNPIGMDVAAYCLRLNSDRCAGVMAYDSALTYLKLSVEADSIFQNARDKAKINEARLKAEYFQRRLENERREASRKLWLAIVGALFIIVSGTIFLLLRLRINREKIRAREAELKQATLQLEVEKERRKIISTSLIMTEKDNVLRAVKEDIEKLHSRGDLSQANMSEITSMIRMHESGKKEWEQFQRVFESVSPDFAKHLKQRYPSLTEGDIQLAVYIKAGPGMKQIARMLMMTPGSLKSKRHRLRERMGLSPEESLEDVIRGLD